MAAGVALVCTGTRELGCKVSVGLLLVSLVTEDAVCLKAQTHSE